MTGESLVEKLRLDCAHLADAPEIERRTLGGVGMLVCELTSNAATHADVAAAVARHGVECRESWDGAERRARPPVGRRRRVAEHGITGGIAALIGAILTWLASVIGQQSAGHRPNVASTPAAAAAARP